MTDTDLSLEGGKPEDIPDDVLEVAMKVAVKMEIHAALSTTTAAKGEVIARAILTAKAAEREACAAVADQYSGSGLVVGGSTGSAHQTKRDIAAAIRKRGETP